MQRAWISSKRRWNGYYHLNTLKVFSLLSNQKTHKNHLIYIFTLLSKRTWLKHEITSIKWIYIPSSTIDIFVFTKTWLSDKINTGELGFNNHYTYRCDRNKNTSLLSTGGGVLIAVNDNFTSQLLKIPNTKLEIVFVLIKSNRTNIF